MALVEYARVVPVAIALVVVKFALASVVDPRVAVVLVEIDWVVADSVALIGGSVVVEFT